MKQDKSISKEEGARALVDSEGKINIELTERAIIYASFMLRLLIQA